MAGGGTTQVRAVWGQGDDCRAIIMENAFRFACGLIVQETGFRILQAAGFTLISADDLNAYTPTQNLIRQVLGALAQFEKVNLASKLKAARDR